VIGYLAQNHSLVHAFRSRPLRRRASGYLELNRALKMAPILSDYFNEGEILAAKGSLDRPISGLVMDSRRVVPGNLFFALPGLRADGASFLDEAVSRGASGRLKQSRCRLAPGLLVKAGRIQPSGAERQIPRNRRGLPRSQLERLGIGTDGLESIRVGVRLPWNSQ